MIKNKSKKYIVWGCAGGILYCAAFISALMMALAAGVFPDEKTPLPTDIAVFIAGIGRTFLKYLMYPLYLLMPIYRLLPGAKLAGMDYVYLFLLGFLLGIVVFFGKEAIIRWKRKYKYQ